MLPKQVKTKYLTFDRIEDKEGLHRYRVSVIANPDMNFVLEGIKDAADLKIYTENKGYAG